MQAEENLRRVLLQNGSFDGQIAMAPEPPATLRLGVRVKDVTFSELYMYVEGRSHETSEHGKLPVMTFIEPQRED